MFRIITANVNGIRAAERKGFWEWIQSMKPDCVCLQETKAQLSILGHECGVLEGYHRVFSDALKKGYSGVAMYSLEKPSNVQNSLGLTWADEEGRWVSATIGPLNIASLYLPSGTSGEVRQSKKMDLLQHFKRYQLREYIADKKPWVIAGDWNIAHRPIDLTHPKANAKSSGFLPEERAWLDDVMALGWLDAFRLVNQQPEEYTWWTYRGNARAKNVGWRIDYQMISPQLGGAVHSAWTYKDHIFSDHAPVVVDYEVA
ncbi:MAG: exodeoxyribonuclease III [Candidatus Comchoanobacterales bacterium]